MSHLITSRWIGRVSYEEALALQESLVQEKIEGSTTNHLLLLEHEPVYTMGRTRDESSLQEETNLPYPVQRTNRGGQATYHGPGQLVGYPILDLGLFDRDLHAYLRFLEEALILLLARYDMTGERLEGKTGVWVGGNKIASLGVGVRRWVSMHGFAINICGDLAPFSRITPCGLPGVTMTSLEAEGAKGVSVKSCASQVGEIFNELLRGKNGIWKSGKHELKKS
jgi:lipoyl(octanoyl) transferase